MRRIDQIIAGDTYYEELMQVMHRSYRTARIYHKIEVMEATALAVLFIGLAFAWAGGLI